MSTSTLSTLSRGILSRTNCESHATMWKQRSDDRFTRSSDLAKTRLSSASGREGTDKRADKLRIDIYIAKGICEGINTRTPAANTRACLSSLAMLSEFQRRHRFVSED